MFENGLFIFHRDLRTFDNIGLINASSQCKKLYVCFIFTPEQIGTTNKYRSNNSIQFMIESLDDLQKEISNHGGELVFFYGKQVKIVDYLIEKLELNAIFFNKDYTPYALKRDEDTISICKKHNIECMMSHDYYLYEPGSVLTSTKTAFKKYTPFFDSVKNKKIDPLLRTSVKNIAKTPHKLDNTTTLEKVFEKYTKNNPNILVHGGRKNGLQQLKKSLPEQRDYAEKRDYLTYKTTFLSAYIKFGCVSIREVYHAYKDKYGLNHGLLRELIWREFFAHVLYAYPEVVGQSYQPKFRNIKWSHSEADFEKWCKGNTGFPAVDAGMRQLNTTGYMHNRLRMVCASFLIKVLLIDWRLGEQYFAQNLTDYDIASNNGNWQGISGTGVDMKPYFRDMNPWIQSAKFDKDAEFIKLWVSELNDVDAKDLHKWNIACNSDKYKGIKYPCPMVDYTEQKAKMIKMYEANL